MSEPDYKRETLQTAEERSGGTVSREVADRLAEALEASLAVLQHPDPSGHPALADYRKAVARGE